MSMLLIASSEKYKPEHPALQAGMALGFACKEGKSATQVMIPSNANDAVTEMAKQIKRSVGIPYMRKQKLRGATANLYRETLVRLADVAVIFWDGRSRGTQQLVDMVERKGIPFMLVMV